MFDFKKFLKEGGVEKYLLEAQFGNDIESRYQYIRPLMSRLPDSARTEAMIDGMEEARAEDDKMAFDFYFVETMKMLGLETELMEADSLVNPEAEEIDAEDLDAAADYFDSLAENDTILDEFLQMPAQEEEEDEEDEEVVEKEAEVTININLQEGKFEVGDMVVMKTDQLKGAPMTVIGTRRLFGTNFDAVEVETQTGETAEYSESQLVKIMSPEEKANAFVREGEVDEGRFDRLKAKVKGAAAGAGQIAKNLGGAVTGDASKVSSVKDAAQMAKFKSLSSDAIKQNDKALADIKKVFQDKKVSPKTMEKIQKYFDKSAELKKIQQALVGTVNEVEGEVQSEAMSDQLKINKLLQAANTIEDSLNDVNLELTDEQIDKFTEMILDLRAKAKAKLTNEGFGDQVGAAVSGIGKGISSVLSILIGGVVAIGVLIFSGAIAAASGILAVLGIAGVGLIRAVEQFVVIPKINSTLKRLSEDEEVMAIAMKPSASGLRKIADEKLTRVERLVVGDWIKKNVTRSMLGVNRRYKGGKYVATKSKRGPGLGKDDYIGLTEE